MQVCIWLQTDNHASAPLLSFLQAGCPSWCPANSVKALKATRTLAHQFNSPSSGTTGVSRYQKAKPIRILLKWETLSGSGISWAICKSAFRSRLINTPAPRQFLQARCPSWRPTNSVKALKAWHSCYLYLISAILNMFTCFCCRIRCNDAFQVGRRHALFLCSRVFRTFVYHFCYLTVKSTCTHIVVAISIDIC